MWLQREMKATGLQCHGVTGQWGLLQLIPLAVAIEEDSPVEPRITSLTPQDLVKVGSNDEIIPGPYMNVSNFSSLNASELDLSLTEHHRKGGGILASQRELNSWTRKSLPPGANSCRHPLVEIALPFRHSRSFIPSRRTFAITIVALHCTLLPWKDTWTFASFLSWKWVSASIGVIAGAEVPLMMLTGIDRRTWSSS